ncbi:hypothetical protein D6C76_00986 [Aureobasidium pullulans]|nr:hypothetical protein D6C76_00986 [Aureobasidium pullulans]
MTTQDNFDAAMPTQDQRDIVRPSTELGTPSLTIVQVSRSPSLPSGSPFWDQMDLISPPSSPSPSRVPKSTMDLDRYVQRGFSEDLALPPRQIEKPFRFLDLPAELRIMVFGFAFEQTHWSSFDCPPWSYNGDYNVNLYPTAAYLSRTKWQWRPPPLSEVNKQLRQETLSMYYGMHDFVWYWDVENVVRYVYDSKPKEFIQCLENRLNFLESHGIRMKSITFLDPKTEEWGAWSIMPLIEAVRTFAPLQRSLSLTGKAHRVLDGINFVQSSLLTRRVFDFAGSLSPEILEDEELIDRELRRFLGDDRKGRRILRNIVNWEWRDRRGRQERRRMNKERKQKRNAIEGEERWGGVLRGRPARDESGTGSE